MFFYSDALAGSNAALTRIDYDRDRKFLIASSNDKNVRIWNLDTSRLMVSNAILAAHTVVGELL